jgi:tRNA (Thr-GGU) A37 N-methylase
VTRRLRVRRPEVSHEWDATHENSRPAEIVSVPVGRVVGGLDGFSHLEVVYHFDRVPVERIETGARHPRGNTDWPLVGIFAQRGKNRPNRIGVPRCRLLRTDGLDIHVEGLDVVDGTPVLDIKPYLAPRTSPPGRPRSCATTTDSAATAVSAAA